MELGQGWDKGDLIAVRSSWNYCACTRDFSIPETTADL